MQAKTLLLLGALFTLAGGAGVVRSAASYSSSRAAWRAQADRQGTAAYDAATSDRHYAAAEVALLRTSQLGHVLGFGLLLALTGLFGARSVSLTSRQETSITPGRALAVVWLDSAVCVALLIGAWAATPYDLRIHIAVLYALRPWSVAALLTAPVAAGFTLAGLLLGTRLRDDAGQRPSTLRALLSLPLLPLTLLSALLGLPVHLWWMSRGRHPGSQRVTPHLALLGLHTIRWRPRRAAA